MGVRVDSVVGIITFQPESAQWTDQGGQHELIKGKLQLGGQLYILTEV